MKQAAFEKEIFIRATLKKTIALVSDYTQHYHINPLIKSVEVARTPPAGALKRFFITEQLQWGPFRFKIKYRVDVISVSENSVHTEAYQSPGTHITNFTTVTPREGGVKLHERLTLKAPDMLFEYAFQKARDTRGKTLERIKAYLEG